MSIQAPRDDAELTQIMADAHGGETPLEIIGSGSKRSIGNAVQAAATVSLSAMKGITLYEPAELVVRARAGTPVAELEAALAAENQRLAFEPPALDRITGHDTTTVGGMAASNFAGPRRIMAGAVRDGMIGVKAVTGTGAAIKSGGRVMKDVTGLDLVKLLSGSWGTLAVMSEITFKLLPMAETEATLCWQGLADDTAIACLSAALGSPYEVTGAAHLPDGRTVIRIEGFEPSVNYRTAALRQHLAQFGSADVSIAAASAALWRDVREVGALPADDGHAIWRASVAPSRAPAIVNAVRESADVTVQYDWGGGLIWLATAGTSATAVGEALRGAIGTSGHATLMKGPEHTRAILGAFQPLPAPAAQMAETVRAVFDPKRILNPGRLHRAV